MSSDRLYKPKILGFVCQWWGYSAADLAGVSRLQYKTEVRLIRVMCAGRVDLDFVLKAFSEGMDGVFIGACRLGECNYITHGNYDTRNMVYLCKEIMQKKGLDPERLRIKFISGADGGLFVEVMNDFSKKIEELGPLGQGEGIDYEDIKSEMEGLRKLVPYIKITEREKLSSHQELKEEQEKLFSSEGVDRLLTEIPSYYIDPQKCQACMICLKRCPVDAIKGGKNRIHVIDQEKCIKCGTCYEVCPPRLGAVQKYIKEPVPTPIPEEKRIIVRKKKDKSQSDQ